MNIIIYVSAYAYACVHASRGSCKPGTLIIIYISCACIKEGYIYIYSTFVTCTETAMALYILYWIHGGMKCCAFMIIEFNSSLIFQVQNE